MSGISRTDFGILLAILIRNWGNLADFIWILRLFISIFCCFCLITVSSFWRISLLEKIIASAESAAKRNAL
ncbi:hypothetical protein DR084_02225 [Mycoplasma flocculare]|nr:hypothetical protein [Mesomycoplasma flocculare]